MVKNIARRDCFQIISIAVFGILQLRKMQENSLPTSLFLHDPPEHLLCCICLNVLRDPTQCLKGHSFCRLCLTDSLKRAPECPIDRDHLQVDALVPNRGLSAVIDSLEIQCPFITYCSDLFSESSIGLKRKQIDKCSWTGRFSDAENHVGDCVSAHYFCTNFEYLERIPQKILTCFQKHFSKRHRSTPSPPSDCVRAKNTKSSSPPHLSAILVDDDLLAIETSALSYMLDDELAAAIAAADTEEARQRARWVEEDTLLARRIRDEEEAASAAAASARVALAESSSVVGRGVEEAETEGFEVQEGVGNAIEGGEVAEKGGKKRGQGCEGSPDSVVLVLDAPPSVRKLFSSSSRTV